MEILNTTHKLNEWMKRNENDCQSTIGLTIQPHQVQRYS